MSAAASNIGCPPLYHIYHANSPATSPATRYVVVVDRKITGGKFFFSKAIDKV